MQTRPQPPEGYDWQELKECRSAVLLPRGWQFSQNKVDDTLAYFVTRDEPLEGKFTTGLTVNVVRNLSDASKLKPSLYAAHYVQEYLKQSEETVEQPESAPAGPFDRISCQVIKRFPQFEDQRFRVRMTTFANDKADALYILIFASPVDEWEQSYRIGEQLFNPIVLAADPSPRREPPRRPLNRRTPPPTREHERRQAPAAPR